MTRFKKDEVVIREGSSLLLSWVILCILLLEPKIEPFERNFWISLLVLSDCEFRNKFLEPQPPQKLEFHDDPEPRNLEYRP